MFTAEPYGIDPDALHTLSDELDALGLRVTVFPRSGWYPGSTILLLIAAKEVDHNHAERLGSPAATAMAALSPATPSLTASEVVSVAASVQGRCDRSPLPMSSARSCLLHRVLDDRGRGVGLGHTEQGDAGA